MTLDVVTLWILTPSKLCERCDAFSTLFSTGYGPTALGSERTLEPSVSNNNSGLVRGHPVGALKPV